MKNHTPLLKWAADCLVTKGYSLQRSPEIVVKTPWSTVIRFQTITEDLYLKQTPPSLFLESNIIQLLANQFQASVPIVIAAHDELHCFLMKDAGLTLRHYLKKEFQPAFLVQAIQQYTTLQRSTENQTESFLALGVPDWRLEKLPHLYDQLTNQTEFLKAEGMTDVELQMLPDLNSKISKHCEALAKYPIPETLSQPDFNTNNILLDPKQKKLTFIDLGEIAITHPFFSLCNFLYQATLHHGVKDQDETYLQLQNACFKNWLTLATPNQLLDVLMGVKKLWPIYSALAHYRLMMSVDRNDSKTFYADRPNRLAGCLREYAASS